MNTLEDRIRAAMHAAGETVTPDSAPPLRLPPARRRAGARTGHRRWRGWSGWLAPVAAAVAVAAVVAAAETLPALITGAGKGYPPAWAAGIPPYYVVLTYSNPALGPRGDALVRATATGRLLATIRPPSGRWFTAVTADADEHTFVLAAQTPRAPGPSTAGPIQLFRFSIGQRPGPPRLSALPVRVEQTDATLTGLALSPDGTKLAIALTLGLRSQIRVVSMTTGRSRTWTGLTPGAVAQRDGPGVNWISSISWAADDRTLAYQNQYNVRLLDTAAPGGRLKLDSSRGGMLKGDGGERVALTCTAAKAGHSPLIPYLGNAILTPDSHLIIVSDGFAAGKSIATIPPGLWRGGNLTYPCSAAGWRAVRSGLRSIRYGKLTGSAQWVYWASPGGHSLIVVAKFGLGGHALVGVLRGDHFTPLPGTSRISAPSFIPAVPGAW